MLQTRWLRPAELAVLCKLAHISVAVRPNDVLDWGAHGSPLQAKTSLPKDTHVEEEAYLQQEESDASHYRPNQTLVDTTLGVVKQYLNFVSNEQLKVRNQVEGMERAFQSRLTKLENQLQSEIKAGSFKPDQRLQEAKAKMDTDKAAAKEVFDQCRAKAKDDQSKAAQLIADSKQCKLYAKDLEDKEKAAQETIASNRPKMQQEKELQEAVYAKVEQLERTRDFWTVSLEEAELKAKTAFNFAAQANSSLQTLIDSRDKLEREKANKLDELKRDVDKAENVSVGTGVVHAGTVDVAKELSKSSEDVLKDAQSTEKAATDLIDLLGDVKGAIDKLYFTGPNNLGMTTDEFFDYEDEVYKAFASNPVDVTDVNIDDWKGSFENIRSEKEQLLIDVSKQVKGLLDNNTGSLFANMRSLASNTQFTGQVMPLLVNIQQQVAQAAAEETTAACKWYTDATYGPSPKTPDVVAACSSLGGGGTVSGSLLQRKVSRIVKIGRIGTNSTTKTRIATSPTLAKSLGDLESILTANKFEMQSRRMGIAYTSSAEDAAITTATEGEQNKQATAAEQARRQEILDEAKRKFLEWSKGQDEEIEKIDRQLGERNAAVEAARLEFEKVQKRFKEVQDELDWHNKPEQVRAREDEVAKHQDNLRQLEEEDARVTSESIAAAESVKQCAERMELFFVAKGQTAELNRTADEKAEQARQLMEAAGQADKRCKDEFRDTKKQVEQAYSAKQDELEIARSINDVQRVKLQEYKDTLDKCVQDYDNVLALSVQVEDYHVKILDPYYASLTNLQTGLGVLFFDALENESFDRRTATTDRLAQRTPMNASEMVQLAITISRTAPAVQSSGESIKQKLETWVPSFNFESRSQMQGKMADLLEEVKQTQPKAMSPWCKWYSLYYLHKDTALDYNDCLQRLEQNESTTLEDTDPLSQLEQSPAVRAATNGGGSELPGQRGVSDLPGRGTPVAKCTQLDQEDDCNEGNIKFQPGAQVSIKCSRSQPNMIGQVGTVFRTYCDEGTARRTYEIHLDIGGGGFVWQSRLRPHER